MSPEAKRFTPCYDIAEKIDADAFPHLHGFIRAGRGGREYDFSPDVYRDVEAFCTTEVFWEEFNRDVRQAARGYKPSLANFFRNYDTSTGRFLQNYKGKYADLRFGHFLRDDLYLDVLPAEQREDLESYVLFRIPLPTDNPRLSMLMRDAREIVRDNFVYPSSYRDEFTKQQLEDPQFWQEFADDIRALDGVVRFDDFLKHFGGKCWNKSDQWTAPLGKYANIHRLLERNRKKGVAKWAEPLLAYAPDELKPELAAFIEKGTKLGIEASLLAYGFPAVLLPAVKRFGNLREDIVPEVLREVAGILAKNAGIRESQAREMLIQYIGENGSASEPTFATTVAEAVGFVQYRDRGARGKMIFAPTGAFLERYIKPLAREELFKEASAYWYQQRGNLTAAAMKLHMHDYWQNQLASLSQDEKNAALVLQPEIDQLNTRLAVLVDLRNAITYFQSTMQGGQPTFLFLHQLDGIQQLLAKEGGIYADEAGLGKTITVGIAALLLAEKAASPWHKKVLKGGIIRGLFGEDIPVRVLVVGSKAVIDNWEKEIGIHTAGIDVINLTFSLEEAETVVIPRLPERKFRFFQQVNAGGTNPQFLLVHYDIFRDPDFVARLGRMGIGSVVIDEAHNVKTGVLSVLSESIKSKNTVAQRTQGLYRFLEGFGDSVIFSTGTPFVKNLREPLLMAHVVNKELVPLRSIAEASRDPGETNKLLEPVMVRHLKKDVVGLPEKSITYIRIPFDSLGETDVRYLRREVDRIFRQTEDNSGQRFFATLNLEIQAKLPWLTEEVKRIQREGRKVVVFTPFVHGEKTLTKESSTVAVAEHLHRAGIEGVAVLDSSLSSAARLAMQDRFHQAGGLVKTLVASYGIGGEGITLSSFENKATHAIVLVPPNSLARFLQSIDRIHRFGQPFAVDVLIPFVEGFSDGQKTYDQRLVERLQRELGIFERAIDGRFRIEKDFYHEVGGIFPGSKLFTSETMEQKGTRSTSGVIFNAQVLGESTPSQRREYTRDDLEYGAEEISAYVQSELASLPRGLSREQIEVAYKYIKTENGLQQLIQDPVFQQTMESCDKQTRQRIASALSKSNSVAEFVFHSNLALVRYFARRFSRADRDRIMDFVQEGSIVLLNVIEKFDPERGVPFGSYAATSIYRAFLNIVREYGKQKEVSLDTSPEGIGVKTYLETIADPSVGIEEEVVGSENIDILKRRLQRVLTPRQWEVVSLVLEGREKSEIAEMLETSRQNVSLLLRGAEKKVKRVIEME